MLQSLPDWKHLPAGVKFDPTDQELLQHLHDKVGGSAHPELQHFIPTLDEDGICGMHPELLPGSTKDGSNRHYFHLPAKAYNVGTRKRRRIQANTQEMRWHKTGKTRPVKLSSGKQVGWKKILVLYTIGKGSKSQKTRWVTHQYHLGPEEEEDADQWVVTKLFYQIQPRQTASSRKADPSDSIAKSEDSLANTSPDAKRSLGQSLLTATSDQGLQFSRPLAEPSTDMPAEDQGGSRAALPAGESGKKVMELASSTAVKVVRRKMLNQVQGALKTSLMRACSTASALLDAVGTLGKCPANEAHIKYTQSARAEQPEAQGNMMSAKGVAVGAAARTADPWITSKDAGPCDENDSISNVGSSQEPPDAAPAEAVESAPANESQPISVSQLLEFDPAVILSQEISALPDRKATRVVDEPGPTLSQAVDKLEVQGLPDVLKTSQDQQDIAQALIHNSQGESEEQHVIPVHTKSMPNGRDPLLDSSPPELGWLDLLSSQQSQEDALIVGRLTGEPERTAQGSEDCVGLKDPGMSDREAAAATLPTILTSSQEAMNTVMAQLGVLQDSQEYGDGRGSPLAKRDSKSRGVAETVLSERAQGLQWRPREIANGINRAVLLDLEGKHSSRPWALDDASGCDGYHVRLALYIEGLLREACQLMIAASGGNYCRRPMQQGRLHAPKQVEGHTINLHLIYVDWLIRHYRSGWGGGRDVPFRAI
eukprot:SM000446S16115  [mRNA]  locus=s446:307:4442:+ [translate_table: standard]